jgi:hypothetical protein
MADFPSLDALLLWPIVSGLCLLFGTAALHKARAFGDFQESLRSYAILPRGTEAAAAALIIAAEALGACGLWWQPLRAPAALLVAGLLCLYAVAIGVNLRRGRTDLDCGCHLGGSRQVIATWMVWRNCALCAVTLCLCLPIRLRQLGAQDWLDIIGISGTSVLLYRAAHLILGEFAPRARSWSGGT